MKISVDALRPNPFRHLERYPIDQEKVAALVRSIKDTEFWDNLVVRKSPIEKGAYELAYGHHRHVALKKAGVQEIDIPVRDLDDTLMAQIMAHENMEEWDHSASIEQETVRAIIEGYADGRIKLKHSKDTTRGTIRIAPSFRVSPDGEASARGESSYTAESLVKFLGWNKHKVDGVLTALAAIEDDLVEEGTFKGLSTKQAEVVVGQMRRIERELGASPKHKPKAKKVAKAVGESLAAGFKQSASGYDRTGRKRERVQDVTIHNAKSRADEMTSLYRKKAPKSKPRRDVSIVVDEMVTRLIEMFPTQDMAAKLNELIAVRDEINPKVLRQLVGGLRALAARAESFAAKLDGVVHVRGVAAQIAKA